MERLLVYTGMYTFGGKSVISYILSESYSIRICRCADRTERRFFSTEIQIDDVQKMLDEIMDDHVFSVREALMNIINGEEPVSKETVRSFLYSLFFSDIENEKGLILKLLLVIFIAAVLAEFADVFGNGQAGSISFYIVYLALFTMLMENF